MQDIQALPEHLVGEILGGELVVSPRPSLRHARAATSLGTELVGPFQRGRGGPGGWWILFEPELHLEGDIVVPDLAGWRRERMPEIPDAPSSELPPDWVCEVLSPSTAAFDRTRKLRRYALSRVEWLWFVDPAARTIEALQLRGLDWVLAHTAGGGEKARIPPFDAVELELDTLWDLTAALPPTP